MYIKCLPWEQKARMKNQTFVHNDVNVLSPWTVPSKKAPLSTQRTTRADTSATIRNANQTYVWRGRKI